MNIIKLLINWSSCQSVGTVWYPKLGYSPHPKYRCCLTKYLYMGPNLNVCTRWGRKEARKNVGTGTGEDDRMWNYEQAASETAAALYHNFYGEDLDKKGTRVLLLSSTVKLIISKAIYPMQKIKLWKYWWPTCRRLGWSDWRGRAKDSSCRWCW